MTLPSIRSLREEMNLSLGDFARLVGVSGRGQMSEIERGLEGCPPMVAIEIERISGGRIDAGAINPVIAAARASEFRSHDGSSAIDDEPSDLTVLCATCERRADDPATRGCSYFDCPRAGQSDEARKAAA